MSFPSASPPWPRSPRTPPSSNYRSMIHCPRSSRRRRQISPPPFYNPISRPAMAAQWRRCYPLLLRFKRIFNREKKKGGRANERIGRNFWAKMNDFGGDGWSNDLTMEEEMEEIIWCEPCWVNLMVKRCWWFIRLSFGRKRKKRRKYLSQKLLVGDRILLLKIKKYNLETELEHCKSIDTTNSRKLFPTSLEIRIILIKMWVIARFIRDSARNYDSIEISFYLHEMKMYNRIKNGVKVRGVNEGDGGEKKNVFPFCSVSSVSKSSITLEKRHMKMTKL